MCIGDQRFATIDFGVVNQLVIDLVNVERGRRRKRFGGRAEQEQGCDYEGQAYTGYQEQDQHNGIG